MPQDTLMRVAVQLGSSLEALAALTAHVRIENEQIEADPEIRDLLAAVAAELVTQPEAVNGPDAGPMLGMVRAFLRQASDLVENPGRAGGWAEIDEPLVQGIGRLSMAIVDAFRVAENTLAGLGERLRAEGATFLDVGTGAGWLAIAMARAFPALRVVGIDVFEPSLSLARRNVADEGFGDRIELRVQDGATIDEVATYDVIWLPLPFLPAGIVRTALAASLAALRPGGWVIAGGFAGPDDHLSKLLVDLRTVRSGGHPWQPEEMAEAMTAAGLVGATEVPRTWAAPVRLYAGQQQ